MEDFQMEIEEVKEKLEKIEMKSERLEKEIGFFKAKELKLGQHLGKNIKLKILPRWLISENQLRK